MNNILAFLTKLIPHQRTHARVNMVKLEDQIKKPPTVRRSSRNNPFFVNNIVTPLASLEKVSRDREGGTSYHRESETPSGRRKKKCRIQEIIQTAQTALSPTRLFKGKIDDIDNLIKRSVLDYAELELHVL